MEGLKMDSENLEIVRGCKDNDNVVISGKVLKKVTFEDLNNITLVLNNCKIVDSLSIVNCTINKIELVNCYIPWVGLGNIKGNYKDDHIYIDACVIDCISEVTCNLPQRISGCNINDFSLKNSTLISMSYSNVDNLSLKLSTLEIKYCTIQELAEDRSDLLLNDNMIFHTITDREDLRWQLMNGKVLSEPLIAYKKVEGFNFPEDVGGFYVLELELPKGAVVFSNQQRKCRTNTAKVLRVLTLHLKDVSDYFKSEHSRLNSLYDKEFTYELGKTYTIDNFDLRNYEVCSNGIHCFLSANEAAEYFYN